MALLSLPLQTTYCISTYVLMMHLRTEFHELRSNFYLAIAIRSEAYKMFRMAAILHFTETILCKKSIRFVGAPLPYITSRRESKSRQCRSHLATSRVRCVAITFKKLYLQL